jgi:hypothetical protein
VTTKRKSPTAVTDCRRTQDISPLDSGYETVKCSDSCFYPLATMSRHAFSLGRGMQQESLQRPTMKTTGGRELVLRFRAPTYRGMSALCAAAMSQQQYGDIMVFSRQYTRSAEQRVFESASYILRSWMFSCVVRGMLCIGSSWGSDVARHL